VGARQVEAGVSVGSLDHLFLDEAGVPTLVEVKRSSDTRARREMVAQMLDYFNNELGGADEPAGENAYRVMSNVFGLDDEDEEETQSPAPPPATAAAPGPYKEIRAEKFTLVDEAGNERARLWTGGSRDAILTMLDSKGRPRLRLRAGDNEAMITICGERGEWGKGVLPATDEAERVMIGYESAEQDARIVIQDGNERECVTLGIFAEGDGFICLRQPGGGSHTVVSSDGLIAFDGDGAPLPEYGARQAEAPRTEPTPTAADLSGAQALTDRPIEAGARFGCFWARSALGDRAVRDLVSRIIPRDDDGAVKAFVALVDAIAYNDDRLNRDGMAICACDAAYQRSMAYHDEAGKFFDKAMAELRPQAS